MHYCALVFSVVTFFWLKGRSRIPNTLLYFESLRALLCFLSHGFLEIGCQGQEDNTRISYYFEILVLNYCVIWSFFTEKGNDFQKQNRCKKKLSFSSTSFWSVMSNAMGRVFGKVGWDGHKMQSGSFTNSQDFCGTAEHCSKGSIWHWTQPPNSGSLNGKLPFSVLFNGESSSMGTFSST